MGRVARLAVYDAAIVDDEIKYGDVVATIRRMKNGKAARAGKITAELVKAAIDNTGDEADMIDGLASIFNQVLESGEPPGNGRAPLSIQCTSPVITQTGRITYLFHSSS